MNETPPKGNLKDALDRARRYSPYLGQQLERFPDIEAALTAGDLDRAMELARTEAQGDDVSAALRRERNAYSLAVGIGDLAGIFSLEQVTCAMSEVADRSLQRAIDQALIERTPGEQPRGFAAIALGKLGGHELNYSSDVDLVFLYDPETLPLRPREETGQAALRVAQRVVELIQKRTEEGFAFRIDLRLRPSPEVTPIALPVDAAISYYESSALPWERAAFIRARHSAGDEQIGRYFLEAIHPFVWRRSVDFGAIGEIQSISRRIRSHYSQGQKFGPGFDVKRGRGGIREAEFFAQIHQLIHGGRDPSLRSAATLPAIAALREAGRISEEAAEVLASAYRVLRTVEHRLQMVDDRQTHSLPLEPGALGDVAQLHGLADGAALLALLQPHVDGIAALYDSLAGEEEVRLPVHVEDLEAQLSTAGFEDPAAARLRIEGWRGGKSKSLRSAAAGEAFEVMLPGVIEAFGKAPDPMRAMNRFDDLICGLPTGVNFFRLLSARPSLTNHLATILSHAPVLAEQLGRRPELLDGLIDETAFAKTAPVPELIEQFGRSDRAGEDYQQVLDCVRRRVNERRFALGVQLIVAHRDPIEVAEGYSRIAEAAINVLADAATAEFQQRHGTVPGSELLILGLGRLGGEALTFASDLDIVYLFSGTHEAESDGPRPLRATDYFNRLAPRVSAALSVPTAAGPLYDVDTRLRPSGADGMLAVSLESFERYQREQAWTWEHMALLRGRPVYGSPPGRAELARTILDILSEPRDPNRVTADVVRMRSDIASHKPAAGPFDIKLGPGGLVDLEFAVHTLQLRHRIGLDPHLEVAIEALVDAGLLSDDIDPALRLLTRMLVMFRLVAPQSGEPPEATRPLVADACGLPDWNALLAAHEQARQRIRRLWREVALSGGANAG
ncbi:MAG TPA: bifunctional [glutamine synthetase] adenylyltransferase/[glutamine synthetase]-adenylyl-L-tyrosine phosphorylase [Allosphingosinicella sp.]|nr:bifunctional [glutamine synthetase] adenylyltransferase/[glutamine synthetase]-adenylyl-L-tyrosine phosphorylase [Allosphingosinicella sp.]